MPIDGRADLEAFSSSDDGLVCTTTTVELNHRSLRPDAISRVTSATDRETGALRDVGRGL